MPHRRQLIPGTITALGLFGVVLGSTIPSGIYALYQRDMGLSGPVTTLVFTLYVLGVVAALLLGGHLSDHVGRRPVILAALVLAVSAAALMYTAESEFHLYAGRVVTGISVGLSTGAFTAALREFLGPDLGAVLSTALTSLALAAGPMFSALQVNFSPDPLHTPYLLYGMGGIGLLLANFRLPESLAARTSPCLVPRIGVPTNLWPAFAPAAVGIACAYGTNGLFQSVLPLGMIRLGVSDQTTMAAATSLMLGVSAVTQILTFRSLGPRALPFGSLVLAGGLAGVAASLPLGSPLLFWTATVLSGAGQGMTFRASLHRVATTAPPSRVAQLVSTYYVVGYLATAAPPMAVSLLGSSDTTLPFVCALLAALALFNGRPSRLR